MQSGGLGSGHGLRRKPSTQFVDFDLAIYTLPARSTQATPSRMSAPPSRLISACGSCSLAQCLAFDCQTDDMAVDASEPVLVILVASQEIDLCSAMINRPTNEIGH